MSIAARRRSQNPAGDAPLSVLHLLSAADMSGRVGDLSPKQAEALEQVRF